MSDEIGRHIGHRDDPRGVLAFDHLPDDLQKAEDSTAVADRDTFPDRRRSGGLWLRPYVERPATDTERLLLAHLGYVVPEQLITRIRNAGMRHRCWPQIPDTMPTEQGDNR
ncbi:hypothetical protein [Gordonia sp. p3-SID1431]|uniref:hypothetical protein n=1 Tax=Gordonia sp. p3-SID1431 TaxID=2916159 RepID=UPI0021A57C8C|nr:hypothetical protein [Gordonia sp. p3-SID1431]MCT1352232.1 hypothetical protein [Gordonia sp. p3-SID1431]